MTAPDFLGLDFGSWLMIAATVALVVLASPEIIGLCKRIRCRLVRSPPAPDLPPVGVECAEVPIAAATIGLAEREEDDFGVIWLLKCRVTNRSPSQPVSLDVFVRVPLEPNPASLGELRLSEREPDAFGVRFGEVGAFGEANRRLLTAGRRAYPVLHCPLDIAPGRSVTGSFGFLVSPSVKARLGRPFVKVVDFTHGVMLEVTDHVSGETVSVPVPGQYPPPREAPRLLRSCGRSTRDWTPTPTSSRIGLPEPALRQEP